MKKLLLFGAIALSINAFGQVPNYVPTNGLVGWWPFNGNANDESGQNHNLIPNGDASLTADRNGLTQSAFSLSDVNNNSRLEFGLSDFSLIDNFNQGSLSMWLKITSHDITNHYFGFDNMFTVRQKSGVNTQFYLGLLGGTMQLRMHLNGALPNSGDLTSNSSLSINTWYNIVYTWDGSTEKIYINGILDNSINSTNYITPLSSPDMFCFGSYGGCGSNSTNSILDDLGIWNRALTQQEITDLYSSCQLTVNTQPNNQTININNNAQFIVGSSDPSATFQWQTDLGVGFQNLNSAGQYSGVTNDTLTVSNVTMSNNNQTFRCIVSSGSCSDTSNVAVLTVNNNVGINETSQVNLFSVFPNPAQNIINVNSDSKLIGQIYSIYDNAGRVVLTGKFNSQNTTIEIGNLSGGIYMFSVGENMSQTFKIIKAE